MKRRRSDIMAGYLTRPARKVKRVLVMIEDVDRPGDGDVYDFTELVTDLFHQARFGSEIGLTLKQDYNYDGGLRVPGDISITFNGRIEEYVCGATHIEDILNFGLPDNDAVNALKDEEEKLQRRIKALQKRSEEIKREAQCAKLMQCAKIRSQHPIAKFSVNDVPKLPPPNTGFHA